MKKNITKTGKLSMAEAKKSIRDWVIFWIITLVMQWLEIAQVTDFWEYQLLATIIIWAAVPFINRYVNIYRV
jgi:hypothetical protein